MAFTPQTPRNPLKPRRQPEAGLVGLSARRPLKATRSVRPAPGRAQTGPAPRPAATALLPACGRWTRALCKPAQKRDSQPGWRLWIWLLDSCREPRMKVWRFGSEHTPKPPHSLTDCHPKLSLAHFHLQRFAGLDFIGPA